MVRSGWVLKGTFVSFVLSSKNLDSGLTSSPYERATYKEAIHRSIQCFCQSCSGPRTCTYNLYEKTMGKIRERREFPAVAIYFKRLPARSMFIF
jgi:hypothetical protein